MTSRGIHLDWKPLFVGLAVIVFVSRQLFLIQRLLRFQMPLDHRIRLLLFHHWAAPRSLIYALLIAGVVTFVLQVLVSLIVGPLVRAWLQPRTDGTAGLFHLAAGESMVESVPARRLDGSSWIAGTLVRSNRSLWFIPEGWDAEPWSVPLNAIRSIGPEPGPPVAWGFVRGVPDRLVVVGNQGESAAFAVYDPEMLTTWFAPGLTPSA